MLGDLKNDVLIKNTKSKKDKKKNNKTIQNVFLNALSVFSIYNASFIKKKIKACLPEENAMLLLFNP